MKIKRISLAVLIALLSLTMMACPSKTNSGPEFVQLVDGEITSINKIEYYYLKGSGFDPDEMLDSIINDQNIIAIDYDQSGVIWGLERDYVDISDRIENRSFWVRYEGPEDLNDNGIIDEDEKIDVNNDGLINETDEELYYTYILDEDGNYTYNDFLISVLLNGMEEFPFTLYVADDDGVYTQISGIIYIVTSLPE